MKLIVQPRQPVATPSGESHALIAGEFLVDDDNLVADTAFGVFVLRRSDVFSAVVLNDVLDLSTLEGVLVLN